MKSFKFLLFTLSLILLSCGDQWDDHYSNSTIGGNATEISPLNLLEYLESKSEFSAFVQALKDDSLASELAANQYLTVWALNNTAMASLDAKAAETGFSRKYLLEYHINNLSYGLSSLKDGLRLISLNGKYVSISEPTVGVLKVSGMDIISGNYFCSNGVMHEVAEILTPQYSIYEYIKSLSDDYSIIRDTLLNLNKIEFDPLKSVPIGVDLTGNTIYDSTFVIKNDILDSAGVTSEFMQSTMFLPNNDAVLACLEELGTLKAQFNEEFTSADTAAAMDWIKRAMFYDRSINNYGDELDIVSTFNKVWRTTIQKLNTDPIIMSNGLVYEVDYLHIPNNINLDRIKELVSYYQYLPNADKATLFTFEGVKTFVVKTADVVSFPELNIPSWSYIIMQIEGDPADNIPASVEFTALRRVQNSDGTVTAVPILIPPGEYNMYMGFQSKNHPYVNVYVDGDPVALDLNVSPSTPWNYDRRTFNRPEGTKWNGVGGLCGIVDLKGEGLTSFKIKVEYARPQAGQESSEIMKLYHWALIPTENNY